MRNLLRCRRGSIALVTAVALVPILGVIALGVEAGLWYLTQQRAYNAADAAAYSGGLALACTIAGSTAGCDPDPTHTYDYSGRQFAAQNQFCDSNDAIFTCASSLPKNTTQTVRMDRGTYDSAGNTWSSSASGNYVMATISQTQPTYLAGVLGLSTVTVGAQAIVQVQNPKNLCGLGLNSQVSALTIGGSSTITGTGCTLMSDGSVKYNSTPNFSGSDWAVDASTGCVASVGHCALTVPYNYNMLPATNPLSVLDSESFNTMPSMTGSNSMTSVSCSSPPLSPPAPAGAKHCYTVSPNTAGTAYGNVPNNVDYVLFLPGTSGKYYFNKGFTFSGGTTVSFAPGTYYFNGAFGGGMTADFAPGTYFFNNSAITFGGTVTCTTCTPWPSTGTGLGVTLVLLGDSSLTISGTANVSLSAPYTNTTSSDLNGVLIDDQAPKKSSNAVTINGGGTVTLGGALYFPNVDVTWGGTAKNTNTTCTEVVANTLTINGNAYLSSDGCASNTIAHTQVVALVH